MTTRSITRLSDFSFLDNFFAFRQAVEPPPCRKGGPLRGPLVKRGVRWRTAARPETKTPAIEWSSGDGDGRRRARVDAGEEKAVDEWMLNEESDETSNDCVEPEMAAMKQAEIVWEEMEWERLRGEMVRG